jgi:DNA-binding FrmR family transcriptional regulator
MKRNEDIIKKALHRIKIIQGHLQSIQTMIEEDTYCVDIIHQSRAVQKSLKKLDLFLLEDHLKTCVKHHMQNGKDELATEELLRLYEYK